MHPGEVGRRTGGLWKHRKLVLHTTPLELMCYLSTASQVEALGSGESGEVVER